MISIRQYFALLTGLSLSLLVSPVSIAQSSLQSTYGFPHNELSYVDENTGFVVIPCLTYVLDQKVVGNFTIELSAINEDFPVRFELESVIEAENCNLTSRLEGINLNSIVEVEDSSQPEGVSTFQFSLNYVGTNSNNKEEFTLEESDLYLIEEGETLLSSDSSGTINYTPNAFEASNSYEIRDAFSSELLNSAWNLSADTSGLSFTPPASLVCDVAMVNLENLSTDYFTISTDSEANPSQPAQLACDQVTEFTRYNFGLFDLPVDSQSFDFLAELNSGWVRSQFRLGEKAPNTLSAITETLFADQNKLWLTLHYRNPENITDTEGLAASERGSYPPADTQAYQTEVTEFIDIFVQQLLNLGLDPEQYLIIQFSNEVVPNDVAPDQPLRYFHGSSQEYLDTLALTYEAIKNTGFDIPVAPGGFASATMEIILDYESDPIAFSDLQPVYDWNVRLLQEGTFDWLDVHIRNEIADIDKKVNWVQQHWLGPIASTEVGGICDTSCSQTEIDLYTPEVQAEDLPQRMQTIFEAGVEIAFWASLVESPDQEPQYEKEGLLTTEFEKKPAFNAYRDLIADLISD